MSDEKRSKMASKNVDSCAISVDASYIHTSNADEFLKIPNIAGTKVWLLVERLDEHQLEIIESLCVAYHQVAIPGKNTEIWQMDFNCKAIGNTLEFYREDFGKCVFLSRAAAVQALKEREHNA